MSQKKLPKNREENQTAITEFKSNINITEIQEKAKQLKLTFKKQERAKPLIIPASMSSNQIGSSKKQERAKPPII